MGFLIFSGAEGSAPTIHCAPSSIVAPANRDELILPPILSRCSRMVKFVIPLSCSVFAAVIPEIPAPKISTSASAFSQDWLYVKGASTSTATNVTTGDILHYLRVQRDWQWEGLGPILRIAKSGSHTG